MGARLKLDAVEVYTEGARTAARVQLSLNDDTRSGRGHAGASATAWQHAVAEATLAAVSAFVGNRFALFLDSVAEVRTGRHALIVVTMLMHDGNRETFLSGTAPITDHPHTAVARAVLHGLNRWLDPLVARTVPEAFRPQPPAGRHLH